MCTSVTNTDTNEIVDTVAELQAMLELPKNLLVYAEGYNSAPPDCCLCPIDIKATVEPMGYGYRAVDGYSMDVEIHKIQT
jgi:hypothetical protein